VLAKAGQDLFELRLYPPAADLFSAAVPGCEDPPVKLPRAEVVRHVLRRENVMLSKADPRTVVCNLDLQFSPQPRRQRPLATSEHVFGEAKREKGYFDGVRQVRSSNSKALQRFTAQCCRRIDGGCKNEHRKQGYSEVISSFQSSGGSDNPQMFSGFTSPIAQTRG
jgi:hypothetical protein